jgi:hypothetical protein
MATKPGSFTLPSDANGRRPIYAWAKDEAGNISRIAIARILLDTKEPVVKVGLPPPKAKLGSLTRIRGTVTEAQPSSGLGKGEFAIRSASCGWWNPRESRFQPGKCSTAVWYELPKVRRWATGIGNLRTPGNYVLLVRFSDRAGNTRTVLAPFKIQ